MLSDSDLTTFATKTIAHMYTGLNPATMRFEFRPIDDQSRLGIAETISDCIREEAEDIAGGDVAVNGAEIGPMNVPAPDRPLMDFVHSFTYDTDLAPHLRHPATKRFRQLFVPAYDALANEVPC
jgi:hypothetical protein